MKYIFSFPDQILKKQTKNRPILEKSLLTDQSLLKQTELGTLHQENEPLEDYVLPIIDDENNTKLLLSKGGVSINQDVVCCNTCLTSLKKDKLPKFSIANNFQIGKTPIELTGLTLAEKLLISKYRPKMYVVKLRASGGPQTQQRGLKGNTITFPQDIVKIATTLPANPDILVDHIRVVFIGKRKPTPEMLKKVLTVRRNKVYDALNFLCLNNHVKGKHFQNIMFLVEFHFRFISFDSHFYSLK